MSAGQRLELYLTEVRQRLRAVVVARASAVVALTALLVTVLAVAALRNPGFPSGAVLIARVALIVALAVAAGAMLWQPLRALAPARRAKTLERHLPTQSGRVETYLELARRREQGFDAPLIDLLAEDALSVAEKAPVSEAVPRKRMFVPAAIGGAALIALAALLLIGNSEWSFGGRNLWFGTPIPKAQIALRQIKVTPGNATVRRNQDVPIRATVSGFKTDDAEVHVRYGDGKDWEQAPMRAGQDGAFEFTVYALREPLSYYVTSRGTKSAEHRISVADVPRIEKMRLTYTYPSWTGLPQETDESSRDIRAVAGTKVSVEVQTSAPVDSPTLVVDGAASGLAQNGTWSRGTLELKKDGHYRVNARVGDEMVPLSDEYDIALVQDQQPTVEFTRPGRDSQASSIEEVPVEVHAKDDFRVENVELHYSINGGAWKVAPLKGRGKDVNGDTILRLEDMTEAPGAQSNPHLTPGDLVTYYAVAKDRKQAVQTDLFLIHVQPFERRFTQGQAGGAGGGGGGDDQQNAISQRQREILLATWNLQRMHERADRGGNARVEEHARMLSEAQGTLADQAKTLIERAEARGVDDADPKNRELIENLQQAAQAMQPAAKHLNDIALPEAIPDEQKALQHLLRAEALYTDIEVQFRNANAGGGGGQQAGRDLAEMFELEMDLDKNQYETESRAGGDDSSQQLDDALRKLRELAQRQERLAREAARQQQGPRESEKWQQEQLKRETEDLRKRLADLAQQNANSQSAQNQSRDPGRGQSQGQSQGESQNQGQGQGQSQGRGQSSSSTASTASEALNQVERALENMRGASEGAQSGQKNGQKDGEQNGAKNGQPKGQSVAQNTSSPNSAAQSARAAQQASRDLQQALEQLEQGRRAGMAGTFEQLAQRAAQLTEEQRRSEEELVSAFSRQQGPGSGTPNQPGAKGPGRSGGLTWERAQQLADQKRSLQNEIEALQRDMQTSAQNHREDAPEASGRVGTAAKDLAESGLSAGLARSAMELERGRGVQAAARERLITDALENLENDLGQAARVAANEARQRGSQKNEATPEELLAELSELRRAWQLAQAGQPRLSQLDGPRGQRGANGERGDNGQPDPNAPSNGTRPGDANSAQNDSNGNASNGGDSASQNGQSGSAQSGGSNAQSGGNASAGGAIGSPNGGGNWGGALNGGGYGGYARGFIDDGTRLNAWNPPLRAGALRPVDSPEYRQQAEEIAKRLRSLLDRMPKDSLAPADLNVLRQLANRLRQRGTGTDRMGAEYERMFAQVDQLELAALSAIDKNRDNAATRTANPTPDSPEYRETVAEYYRRLGTTK